MTPLIYSAKRGHEKICMYLTLRSHNIDEEGEDGFNVFLIYLEKGDLTICKQLLKRGANINYKNKDSLTPLHIALKKSWPEKIIRFLLDFGANAHMEDRDGIDCCEKAKGLYPGIPEFGECEGNPAIRVPHQDPKILEDM